VVRLGYAPKRIDLLTSIAGVEFSDCRTTKCEIDIDGVLVPFIDLPQLVVNERASGRPQDVADVAALVEGELEETPRWFKRAF
jgi:hypothetical protein